MKARHARSPPDTLAARPPVNRDSASRRDVFTSTLQINVINARSGLHSISSPGAAERATPRLTPADAVIGKVNARIVEHVAALTRAALVVDAAEAAALSLDDAALRRTDAMGETLEQVSCAIVEEM